PGHLRLRRRRGEDPEVGHHPQRQVRELPDHPGAGGMDQRIQLARLQLRAGLPLLPVPAHAERLAGAGAQGPGPEGPDRRHRRRDPHPRRRLVLDRSPALQLPVRRPDVLRGEGREGDPHASGRRLPVQHARLLEVVRPAGRRPRVGDGRELLRRQGRAHAGQRREPRLPAGALRADQHPQHQHRKGPRMKPDAPNLKGALDAALAAAKRLAPAGAALVRLESRRDANLRFARNEVTSSGDVDETTLSVEITLGQRHASSDTNQLDPASIEATVNRAIGMAQVAPEDPEVMPPLGPQHYLKAAPASDAPTAALDAATRAKMAREAMGLPSGEGLQMAGYLEHFSSRQLLGTSAGLRAEHQHTGANLSVTARTADGTGSGWAANVSHRIAEVDPVKVGAVARDTALKSAKPTKLDPGRYTVVLEPAAVAELLSFMLFAMEAREADEGQSFFAKPGGGNKIGEQLFGPHVTISSPV